MSWLVRDLQVALTAELDFRGEARNGERAAAFLAARGWGERAAVPKCIPELSSSRVLTMEWAGGLVKANDPRRAVPPASTPEPSPPPSRTARLHPFSIVAPRPPTPFSALRAAGLDPDDVGGLPARLAAETALVDGLDRKSVV